MHVELIELLHAGIARGLRLDGGTEFLKVDTDAVESNGAPAVRALDSVNSNLLKNVDTDFVINPLAHVIIRVRAHHRACGQDGRADDVSA